MLVSIICFDPHHATIFSRTTLPKLDSLGRDGCYLSTSILRRSSVSSSHSPRFSPKQSAQPLFTSFKIFYSSTDPLLHHRPATMARADPMTALLTPTAVWGAMQSQMEAKLANMNLKSPGLKSTIPGFPSPARSAPAPRTASRLSSTPLPLSSLSPDTANTVGNPSDATVYSSALNSKPLTMPRVVFLRRSSPRAENMALGLASSARERSGTISPRKRYRLNLGPYCTDFSGWLCLPLSLSPMAAPSRGSERALFRHQ
ncbi:hypothetical protein EDB83DRAFT_737518 [Lactarius deliciosus]|nr:hypothetical protein EDB83DRAFT_737518 [Lactarius deliciosus]